MTRLATRSSLASLTRDPETHHGESTNMLSIFQHIQHEAPKCFHAILKLTQCCMARVFCCLKYADGYSKQGLSISSNQSLQPSKLSSVKARGMCVCKSATCTCLQSFQPAQFKRSIFQVDYSCIYANPLKASLFDSASCQVAKFVP